MALRRSERNGPCTAGEGDFVKARRPASAGRFFSIWAVDWKSRHSKGILSRCDAIYRRRRHASPELASFECSMCGKILETWNSAWVPTYRFIVGPIVKLPNGERPPAAAAVSGSAVVSAAFLKSKCYRITARL